MSNVNGNLNTEDSAMLSSVVNILIFSYIEKV